MHSPECPDIDNDPNGHWDGSRAVGGNFTLTCVKGFKVPGTSGKSFLTLSCPKTLEWTEDVRCVDIDDCANLKHGCGAFGICTDKVDGYDCNCEQGYPPRLAKNGELVCGNKSADELLCGGHTCGAYGVCIDLQGDFPKFESEDPEHMFKDTNLSMGINNTSYRCECTDGFYDNGRTCVPHDCGRLADELGTWSGSTLFGGEYTLQCPEGANVWRHSSHTAQRRITINCGKKGKWLELPVCHSRAREARLEEMEKIRFWSCMAAVAVCICSAALAAGLTLGLATLEPFGLTVILATNPEHCTTPQARMKLHRERLDARRVLPLVREHHLLLVTLLLFNTVANESLPIFLDEMVPSWAAVLLSVSVVLCCGEILPSAVFTGPSQMRIAATCVPLVKLLQVVFYPVAKPIANLLDHLIEQDDSEKDAMKYSRAELLALIQLHGQSFDRMQDKNESSKSLDEAVLGQLSDRPGAPAASPSTRLLVCCQGDEVVEAAPDCHEEEEGPRLAASELRLINGALALREVPLEYAPYARLCHCVVASVQDRAADVVAANLVRHGVRAVLVTSGSSSGSSSSRPPQSPSAWASTFDKVPAAAVTGCLHPRELLRGGNQLLGTLCSGPLVLINSTSTVLEALQLFKPNCSCGLVVSDGQAHGVVTRTELLTFSMQQQIWSHAEPRRKLSVGSPPLTSPLASPASQGQSPAALNYASGDDESESPRRSLYRTRGANLRKLGLRTTMSRSSSSVDQVLQRSYTDLPGHNSFIAVTSTRSNPAAGTAWSP